jgi:hypothetical protein
VKASISEEINKIEAKLTELANKAAISTEITPQKPVKPTEIKPPPDVKIIKPPPPDVKIIKLPPPPPQSRFTCPRCNESFPGFEAYDAHYKTCSRTPNPEPKPAQTPGPELKPPQNPVSEEEPMSIEGSQVPLIHRNGFPEPFTPFTYKGATYSKQGNMKAGSRAEFDQLGQRISNVFLSQKRNIIVIHDKVSGGYCVYYESKH